MTLEELSAIRRGHFETMDRIINLTIKHVEQIPLGFIKELKSLSDGFLYEIDAIIDGRSS